MVVAQPSSRDVADPCPAFDTQRQCIQNPACELTNSHQMESAKCVNTYSAAIEGMRNLTSESVTSVNKPVVSGRRSQIWALARVCTFLLGFCSGILIAALGMWCGKVVVKLSAACGLLLSEKRIR